ncbi:Katanin p80 WD40 repeat-containing subunit B1 [Glycine max]|nr:Katanin p80 WD40 repeat-containing subunit B1 [Glycine max]KAH1218059.1 Katanin p80 WD40 repeat-containing subunit B1 [Glycine max]
MVRTVAGHRSNCTAVEFHPFGEFFASGSMDTNLKIWDIRKKGCIHTYKGHSQGISIIKFTPDGRWVVSGGFDNVVKVWDLTAGKLLHDFKFHEGHIRSIDFHPLEFLLATGSADRTVKFWDLETFELIGSARPEATGVRSIAFHPDGRALFTGHEDGLKVYSWEPVICHDTIDMGWTTLGDLCIHDGKLLGCSFYRNSVGVWVADISLIEPYGTGLDPKKNESTEQKLGLQGSKLEKVEVNVGPTSGSRSMSPDESKEIKNIYIDSSGGKPVTLQRSGSLSSTKVDLPEEFKEICNLGTMKQSPATGARVKSNEQAIRKSFIAPNIVPRDTPDGKVSAKSEKETITFSKTKPGMLLRPAHVRRASTGRFDVDRFSEDVNSGTFCDTAIKLDSTKEPKFQPNLGSQNEVKESCEDKHPIKSVTDKFDKTLSPSRFSEQTKCDESSLCKEEISPVKYVNGVAVVRGRTRSLVERFERRDKIQINEDQTTVFLPTINETREKVHNEDQIKASPTPVVFERRERIPFNEDRNNLPPLPKTISETDKSPNTVKVEPQIYKEDSNSANEEKIIEGLMQTHDATLSNLRSRLTKLQVVRHFWERNDIKGATNALRKLPDHSVQADVISVLVERMEIFTLDLFSCLLPVLTGLLDSKIERHVKVSLDMLLKVVAVFGPTVLATVSAPPSVGVDLHQEERRECCNKCFMELQKIQMTLPILIRLFMFLEGWYISQVCLRAKSCSSAVLTEDDVVRT